MRNVININQGWKFIREDAGLPDALPTGWQDVNRPHSWNAVDGMDGNGSYLRTTGVYSRTFKKPVQPLAGGRVYVEVLAASLDATVKVNGTVATTHEGGFSTIYAHLSSFAVSEGEMVSRGQLIGAVGQTGKATGPHLHFELLCSDIYLNPEYYL